MTERSSPGFSTFFSKDANLFATSLVVDDACYRDSVNKRLSRYTAVVFINEQYLVESYRVTNRLIDMIDSNDRAFFDAYLSSTTFNDREHLKPFYTRQPDIMRQTVTASKVNEPASLLL